MCRAGPPEVAVVFPLMCRGMHMKVGNAASHFVCLDWFNYRIKCNSYLDTLASPSLIPAPIGTHPLADVCGPVRGPEWCVQVQRRPR